MRWTCGPLIRDQRTCLIVHLSELIQTVDRDNYNGPNSSRRWIFKLINATRWRFDDHHKTTIHPIGRTIATVDCDGLFIGRLRSKIIFYKNRSSRRRTGPRLLIKYSLFSQPFRMPLVSCCYWCISASIECLKSSFDRERRKKSHLELQFLSSSIWNEMPCIRRLIGSFRRLIWVRLRDFILIFHHLVLILLLAS